MLSFIILACQLNVSIPDKNSKGCMEFEEPIYEENITPYKCMMQSQLALVKFVEGHPGWLPRRWTCKHVKPSQKA